MKCIIPSQNVKIVARAIHSLSKIGDELYIEPTNNDLILCSVSSAQSAMCEFRMCRSFFSSYNFTVEDGDIKCKVAMKSCLGVFKNPHCADKQVESCEIRFKSEGTVVIFYIKYTNASTKKFFLPIIDCEKVEANYEKDTPNRIVASSKLLASSFKNFRTNEDEITVKVSPDKIVIKNHLEPGRDKGLMRTELSFQPSEFDCCSIGVSTAVTFTLKEMRAAINFAEPGNLPVTINITKPGDPIVLKVAYQPAYESTYIISTLRASRMDLDSSSTVSQNSSVPSRPVRQSVRGTVHVDVHPDPGPSRSRIQQNSDESIKAIDVDVHPEVGPSMSRIHQNSEESVDAIEVMQVEENHLSHTNPARNTQTYQPTLHQFSQLVNQDQQMDVDNQHINIDVIMSIFQRCFVRSFIFTSVQGHDVVLAEPSDTE